MDQNNSEYGYFLHSAHYEISKVFFCMNHNKFMEKKYKRSYWKSQSIRLQYVKKGKGHCL